MHHNNEHVTIPLWLIVSGYNTAMLRFGSHPTNPLILGEELRLRVFENGGLRKIFGPKREEDGSWRQLHNDELHDLYSSPNIVRVIKSRKMKWAGYVARMERGRVFTGFWLGCPKARDHWEVIGLDGMITLKWTLRG
jgi:hypothetical protein